MRDRPRKRRTPSLAFYSLVFSVSLRILATIACNYHVQAAWPRRVSFVLQNERVEWSRMGTREKSFPGQGQYCCCQYCIDYSANNGCTKTCHIHSPTCHISLPPRLLVAPFRVHWSAAAVVIPTTTTTSQEAFGVTITKKQEQQHNQSITGCSSIQVSHGLTVNY